MDRKLDIGLAAGGHKRIEEVLKVGPELLLRHVLICVKELRKVSHALRLPSGHREALALLCDVLGHFLRVGHDLVLLVVHGSRAVLIGMEELGSCPVEYGHEVVADHLHAELCEVAECLLIVLNVHVTCRKADLDVVMNVDRFHNVHIKAVGLDLVRSLLYLVLFPYDPGHLVMKCPHDPFHTGDLLYLLKCDRVIAGSVPAKCHLHGCILLFGCICAFTLLWYYSPKSLKRVYNCWRFIPIKLCLMFD